MYYVAPPEFTFTLLSCNKASIYLHTIMQNTESLPAHYTYISDSKKFLEKMCPESLARWLFRVMSLKTWNEIILSYEEQNLFSRASRQQTFSLTFVLKIKFLLQ